MAKPYGDNLSKKHEEPQRAPNKSLPQIIWNVWWFPKIWLLQIIQVMNDQY